MPFMITTDLLALIEGADKTPPREQNAGTA